jgi:hypothetical protein
MKHRHVRLPFLPLADVGLRQRSVLLVYCAWGTASLVLFAARQSDGLDYLFTALMGLFPLAYVLNRLRGLDGVLGASRVSQDSDAPLQVLYDFVALFWLLLFACYELVGPSSVRHVLRSAGL